MYIKQPIYFDKTLSFNKNFSQALESWQSQPWASLSFLEEYSMSKYKLVWGKSSFFDIWTPSLFYLSGPLSAIILSNPFSHKPPYPWWFLLVIFHPLTTTLLLGYKSPHTLVEVSWVQSLSATERLQCSGPCIYHYWPLE